MLLTCLQQQGVSGGLAQSRRHSCTQPLTHDPSSPALPLSLHVCVTHWTPAPGVLLLFLPFNHCSHACSDF